MALIEVFTVSLDDLRRYASERHLFAVIDACDEPVVPAKFIELGEQRVLSLYRGTAQEEYWSIAPYLFHVDEEVLKWIFKTLWEKPWGIFVISPANLATLYKHFRKFLLVQSPQGELWYFRFYDPRVFVKFYATCLPDEIRQLFGPIYGYGVCNSDVGGITLLWMEATSTEKADLGATPQSWPFFKLRLEQLAIFQPEVEQHFVNRLVQHLKQKHAIAIGGLTDQALEQRIHAGLQRARRYGFREEATFAAFVGLMFEFAPNFDEHPRIQPILTDEDIAPDDRIDVLVEEATDEDWNEARNLSDPKAWDRVH
jgi:Domain of unknown function (DUF4123)